MFGCAILIKGGHLQDKREAIDILFDGKRQTIVTARRVAKIKTHGTGCTFSAAICAYLARGYSVEESARKAKWYVSNAISRSATASGHSVLNWDYLRDLKSEEMR
jgi:hydroxymethylpyrimidine/phosphomethylpyrimidine kinase